MGGLKERKNNGRIKGTKEQWEVKKERKNNERSKRNERTMEGQKGTKEQWEVKKDTDIKIFVTIIV
jgi:hypothetical protein